MNCPICYAYSVNDFITMCQQYYWNDSNVDRLFSVAFISILDIGNDGHYFHNGHDNVLNINFADVSENEEGCLTEEQSDVIRTFIQKHKGKDFHIHCSAGLSRSQAVAKYIVDFIYGYTEESLNPNNPCLTPNWHVYSTLCRKDREQILSEVFK